MNDQELTTAMRQSVDWAHMDVPEEQIASRGRAIRAARRRRVAAGVTAIAAAGVAAIAAALVLPGPAGPATQDTAYIVSHMTQALDAVPASTILFEQSILTGPGSVVIDRWERGLDRRMQQFRAGRLVSESGSAVTRTTETAVVINYQSRIFWSSSTAWRPAISPSAAAGARALVPSCDTSPSHYGFPTTDNPSRMAALLRDWESCGWLKADGTATVDGATAIRLARTTGGGYITTWYVSPATYLPISVTVSQRGALLSTRDFQWLPPTAANLAKLDLPAVPRGFTRISGSVCNRSPVC
jgi:hypothetical protein